MRATSQAAGASTVGQRLSFGRTAASDLRCRFVHGSCQFAQVRAFVGFRIKFMQGNALPGLAVVELGPWVVLQEFRVARRLLTNLRIEFPSAYMKTVTRVPLHVAMSEAAGRPQ